MEVEQLHIHGCAQKSMCRNCPAPRTGHGPGRQHRAVFFWRPRAAQGAARCGERERERERESERERERASERGAPMQVGPTGRSRSWSPWLVHGRQLQGALDSRGSWAEPGGQGEPGDRRAAARLRSSCAGAPGCGPPCRYAPGRQPRPGRRRPAPPCASPSRRATARPCRVRRCARTWK